MKQEAGDIIIRTYLVRMMMSPASHLIKVDDTADYCGIPAITRSVPFMYVCALEQLDMFNSALQVPRN